jgi:hypothetical protein
MASGYIHKGIMAGKLKGAMPAQTPSGCNHKGLVSRESLVPQQQQQQQQGSKQQHEKYQNWVKNEIEIESQLESLAETWR